MNINYGQNSVMKTKYHTVKSPYFRPFFQGFHRSSYITSNTSSGKKIVCLNMKDAFLLLFFGC